MQYYLQENKTLIELPLRSVDAGAGLDRFSVILQEVDSVYETDLLLPITEVFTTTRLRDNLRLVRIMTDHIRCAVFMIADGFRPANTKKEYVLRRILRRCFLHAHLTSTSLSTLVKATDITVDPFAQQYPILQEARKLISAVIEHENMTFGKVLNRGLKEFDRIAARSRWVVSKEDAFRLYDSLGLPIDITREIALAQDLVVDEDGFALLLKEQRNRSRQNQQNVKEAKS